MNTERENNCSSLTKAILVQILNIFWGVFQQIITFQSVKCCSNTLSKAAAFRTGWRESKQSMEGERGNFFLPHLVFITLRWRFKQGPLLWNLLADWLTEWSQPLRHAHMHTHTHTERARLQCDKERGCGSVGRMGDKRRASFPQANDRKQSTFSAVLPDSIKIMRVNRSKLRQHYV